ncbi:hypothetical protein MXB_5302 [Myxobolus squamalis]|nr:hypothetical protein MXB_5302 [Myxobolus squamalis]
MNIHIYILKKDSEAQFFETITSLLNCPNFCAFDSGDISSLNVSKILLIIIKTDGSMHIMSPKGMITLFTFDNFYSLPYILRSDFSLATSSSDDTDKLKILSIKEIYAACLGESSLNIFIFVRCDNFCVIYRMFFSSSDIIFKRINKIIPLNTPPDRIKIFSFVNNFNGFPAVFLGDYKPLVRSIQSNPSRHFPIQPSITIIQLRILLIWRTLHDHFLQMDHIHPRVGVYSLYIVSKTKNGTELLMTTGMKLPSSVTTMLKILDSHSHLHRKISVSWLIQDGGTIGTLISLTEKMFRRYVLLRSRLNDVLPDNAGLNFARERGNFCETYYLDSNTKQISDHILINKFLSLDLLTCYEVSRKLGGNLSQIFEDAVVFDKLIESNLIK